MKTKRLFASLLLLCTVTMLSAQNMNRYISMGVKKGKVISVYFTADNGNTPVKVVNGSLDTIIYADNFVSIGAMKSFVFYTTDTVAILYGDITSFRCSGNGENLVWLNLDYNRVVKRLICDGNSLTSLRLTYNTALTYLNCDKNSLVSLPLTNNVSLDYLSCNGNRLESLNLTNNSALTELRCHSNRLTGLDLIRNKSLKVVGCRGNRITTAGYDRIMCSLPERSGTDDARIWPLLDAQDSNYSKFMAANSANAKAKGWKVLYGSNNGEIPSTAGNYHCAELEMDKYVTIVLKPGQKRELKICGGHEYDYVKVRLVCGKFDTVFVRGTGCEPISFVPERDTVLLYGGFTGLTCGSDSIYVLDVTHNPDLLHLHCYNNRLSVLDVSRNTALEYLDCSNNSLTVLDVSRNTALKHLDCFYNKLSVLDVSHNTELDYLECRGCMLAALDVSHNSKLEYLYCNDNLLTHLDVGNNAALFLLRCSSNRLTDLDVSNNDSLKLLQCYGNPFPTAVYDKIMCELPVPTGNATCWPLYDTADTNRDIFMAANSANATKKGWKVQYYKGSVPIPATSGKFDCAALSVREVTAASAFLIRPNPARTELNISNAEGEVRVYDIAGRVVWRSEPAGPEEIVLNVAGWAKGMYFVRSGRHTLKFVKE